jgi:uncharacterized phage protein (TIGR02218 family)
VSIYPEALLSHLAGDVTTICHCWRLTRRDGETTGYTDHDRTLDIEGLAYEPQTGFSASEMRETMGLAVDTVDVQGALSSERIREEDIAAGLYDGAKVETLLVNWRNPADFAIVRTATIGKLTRGGDGFVAELESLTHALDRPNGRYVTRTCDAELGDARCGMSLDSSVFRGEGRVERAGAADTLAVSGLDGFADGWFTQGTLTWTGGARKGRTERIVAHRKEQGTALMTLHPSVGPAVAADDTFSVVAGCDKSFATCKVKFANALNFRGFPHLPGNDAAYSYVAGGEGNFDGGPVVP